MILFDGRVRVHPGELAEGQPQLLDEHRAIFGDAALQGLRDRIATADLKGYGGAGFPVARKWQAALSSGGGGIVVANGAESEPGSSKDAALLQLRPHLVLDGLTAAARSTHAAQGVVWLHHGAWHSRTAVERALAERRAAGVTDVPMSIVEGPARYLSGESSAVVNALSGGPALPLTLSVPSAIKGVGGRPTVVHNIETLARTALVATGRGDTGERLLTITTPESRVVVEANSHDRLAALASGLSAESIGSVLLGGYGGRWRRWESVAARPVADLWSHINAGIVMTLPDGACGVSTTARIIRYLSSASAKQCGPCIFGLDEIAGVMERVASGRARRGDITRLQKVSATIAGRGACHHPDGAIGMLASAIEVFGHEFDAHRRTQRCHKRHDVAAPGSRAA